MDFTPCSIFGIAYVLFKKHEFGLDIRFIFIPELFNYFAILKQLLEQV
jgi:hypothetical protein